jgi:hypothetical protein
VLEHLAFKEKLAYTIYIMTSLLSIDWSNPACKISTFFSVGEVTKGEEERIPTPGSEEEINILLLAAELDMVRAAWGEPIGVSSWFRPYAVNRAVGGAIDSQHMTGAAADIYPLEGDPEDFEIWLDSRWGGALGYGAAAGKGFTHVDLREGGFDKGRGDIRWSY